MSSRRLYFDNVFGWTYELACGRSPDINISENFLDFLVRSGLKDYGTCVFFIVGISHIAAVLHKAGFLAGNQLYD